MKERRNNKSTLKQNNMKRNCRNLSKPKDNK